MNTLDKIWIDETSDFVASKEKLIKMTGKALHKLRKRAHIAAAIAAQSAWIEDALYINTEDRRMRDKLFCYAREIQARKQNEAR